MKLRYIITGTIKLDIIIYDRNDHFTIKAVYNKSMMFSNCNIIRIKEHTELKRKLSLCLAGECILITYINKEKDMTFLELMQEYFIDIKLIIYITFQDNDITSRAYALSPRMVVSNNNCRELLPASVAKIMKNYEIA